MNYPLPATAVETVAVATFDPLPLSEVMAHCKAEVEDDTELFDGWLKAATELVESPTGLRLCGQTVAVTYARFPECGQPLELPIRPVRSISSVTYRDGDGVSRTLTGYGTWLARCPPLIGAPSTGWPATICDGMAAVTVTVAAGFASDALIPARAKQAVKLIVGYWNSFRGDGKDPNQYPQLIGIPAGAERLIRQLRPREYR